MQFISLTKPFQFRCFVLVVLSFFALSFPPFAMAQLPATSTPIFSIPPGPYIAAQNVLISDSTSGATIYYTLDGTTPTSSSSVYKDAVFVTSTETIQAIAVAPGYSQSAMASATYTINGWLWAYFFGGASVYPGQTTGNTSTLTLQSLNGFAGPVTLSAVVSDTPPGAHDIPTVSFGSGSSVNLTSGGKATAILTINSIGTPSASNSSPALPWAPGGGVLLAAMFVAGIPAHRRVWRSLVSIFGLACLTSVLGGCGGAGGGTTGTTIGNYTVTVTATSGTETATTTLGISVW